ncbi:MAG TPA: S8 family peptidase [Acidimicrobiales bacterium]|jgi:serine protease AprX|nr:S8 family peptidase [Acidimicrobiales bacterium]
MDSMYFRRGVAWRSLLVVSALGVSMLPGAEPTSASTTGSFIVTDSVGTDSTLAASDVLMAGGSLVQDLLSADGVLASLTAPEVAWLQSLPGIEVTPDAAILPLGLPSTVSGAAPAAVYPQQTGASQLWAKGNTGSGINVAVIDTGIDPLADFAGRILPGVDLTGQGNPTDDQYGHGTFVAGLVAGNGASSGGKYVGEAPGAGLVPVKVAGADGQTDVATVIEGIDWVISHRVTEKIRVINLSLGWQSNISTTINPLDQAVERAWDDGIVVVSSAGNSGPFNGTVLSPGDDPLAITVGAVNDHGQTNPTADSSEDFSSVGPTNPDGWYKPDLATSGASVVSLMAPGSTIADQNPQAVVGTANFVGSGTSFSSAITSGAVALLLKAHNVQPGQVKADLLGSALPGPTGDPFVDGHGLLNAVGAAQNSYQVTQSYGQVSASAGVPGFAVLPGATVQAGLVATAPNNRYGPTATVAGGEVDLPASCTAGGAEVGAIEVPLPTTSYSFLPLLGASLNLSPPLIGTTTVPDLCNGATVYQAGQSAKVTDTGDLQSTDTKDLITLQFEVSIGGHLTGTGSAKNTPLTPASQGTAVELGSTWTSSTWNPALWHGLPASLNTQTPLSTTAPTTWDGHVWNGSVWNGHVWNGSVWNGHVWNGQDFNGNSWDGHVWNGTAWNGHVWNGTDWGSAGSTYDGTPITGAS